jgi:hypothetical protein
MGAHRHHSSFASHAIAFPRDGEIVDEFDARKSSYRILPNGARNGIEWAR